MFSSDDDQFIDAGAHRRCSGRMHSSSNRMHLDHNIAGRNYR